MSIERALIGTTDAGGSALYVEDVFSTYLYTGNGSTQTINNGIDLAGKGGMVWIKCRSSAWSNYLFDTAIGAQHALLSDTNGADQYPYSGISAFNSSGFSLGSENGTNISTATFASWTFRKQAKFFDVVTYTGNGATSQTISHSLGSVPGMIIVKGVSGATDWPVYHRELANTKCLRLNYSTAAITIANFGDTTPTATNFYVGSNNNVNGYTYVAYVFANNAGGFGASGTDSIISCGSLVATGSAVTVNLGWEPQYILLKRAVSSINGDWIILDVMRGLPVSGNANYSFANTSASEATYDLGTYPTSTGFVVGATILNGNVGDTYIYMAIRRPMKTPTSGSQVFAPIAVTPTNGGISTTNFPVDLNLLAYRPGASSDKFRSVDRLRGVGVSPSSPYEKLLITESAGAEMDSSPVTYNWWNTGFTWSGSYAGLSMIAYAFRRAPGFFDVVCYTGTGSTQAVNHNLGVAPELIIIKDRSTSQSWIVYDSHNGPTGRTILNSTANWATSSSAFDNTSPTATVFTVGNNFGTGYSNDNYVAYLFASCPGVSKIGFYTGNGSSQTINCGFAAGARFVLVKQTDNLNDWYVWDTARGIVSADDPHLSLNTAAAEVTTDDSLDPDSTGFIVNQVAATNINVSSATYIYLAIA